MHATSLYIQQRKSPEFWNTKWSKEGTWFHSFGSEWSNKQLNWITTNYPFTYELYRFWFWFGWPYLLYSEFLSTTLARIASAVLKLKWQSAKQLVVVSLIHVVKERNLNKVWVNQKGLSIYFTLVPVHDFSMKNDVSSFPNVTTAETCTVHIPKTK